MNMHTVKHCLLICTVGGSPEPIIKSVCSLKPSRIHFICSDESKPQVKVIVDKVNNECELAIHDGMFDILNIKDPENLEKTLQDLRELDRNMEDWLSRSDEHSIFIDYTGGTKVMSAAVLLITRRWMCTFMYIGGEKRNKGGVGTVISGFERPISQFNPWDTLGYQHVEEAVTLFNGGGYAAAANHLDKAVRSISRSEIKRELATLKSVIQAYAAWDRFDFKQAVCCFDAALKNRNDLKVLFPGYESPLVERIEDYRNKAYHLANTDTATLEWIADLFNNARRRAKEGRYDDAVARLYCAFEAVAQLRLKEKYSFDTTTVRLDQLPEELKTELNGNAHNGIVSLGLQNAYRLLDNYDDDISRRFKELGLADKTSSPFSARNRSILAHGFEPVSEKVYSQLLEKFISLTGFDKNGGEEWRLPSPRK